MDVATLLPYFGLLIFTQTLLSTSGPLLILKGKEREFMISGWVSAFFLISGIVLGAFTSLIAIVQFYSISFFLFVLTFTLFYGFIYSLNFDRKKVFIFWIPKILISTSLWISLYFSALRVTELLIFILTLYLLFDGRKEIYKISLILMDKKLI